MSRTTAPRADAQGRPAPARSTLTLGEFRAACTALGFAMNPEQADVVEAPAGEDLHDVAGPGTGKTSSLVNRILKVILVDGLRPSGVVAVTFTVKAAGELRSRLLTRGFAMLEHLAGLAALPPAVRARVRGLDVNQVITNTVDGLCQGILREHREPGTNPPVVVDEFVSSTLMLRAGLFEHRRDLDSDLDAFLRALPGVTGFGWNVGRKNALLRTMWDRRFHDQVDWASLTAQPGVPAAFKDALEAYERRLRAEGMVDFALLEQTVLDRLSAGGLRGFTDGVQAILVDEYQDTNLLQERLYFTLATASGASLAVVGDDDQSLFRFRGATVDLFRDFPARFAAATGRTPPRTVFLRRNYRSSGAIVDFVNGFATLDGPYQAARVTAKPALISARRGPGEAPVLAMFRPDIDTLADDLAAAVASVFRGPGLILPNGDRITAAAGGDLGDAALLCASPREETQDGRRRLPGLLRDKLAALSPPVLLFNPRGEDIAAVPVVAEFGGMLLLAIDPVGTVEAASARGLGGAAPTFADWRAAGAARLAAGSAALQQFHAGWASRTPRRGGRWPRSVAAVKLVYGLLHYFPDLHNDPEGQVYLEVFTRQLSACAAIGTFDGELVTVPSDPDKELASARELLQLFLAPIANGTTELNEDLIEAFPRNRLAVLSVHQAKGLEFPLTIVDVGSDFRSRHHTHAFKRFPREGGVPHGLEDLMRPHSPLGPPGRTARDRAFDDIYRQYFVAFSRPETVLLLVGTDAASPRGPVENVASGSCRDGSNPWSATSPLVEL